MEATIAEIRLGLPLRMLATEPGWSLQLRDLWDVTLDDLAAADVLVLQRPVSPRALTLLRRMQAGGGRVICEIDDLLTEPAEHLLGAAQARGLVSLVQRALAAADLVSASTPRLAQALRAAARQVTVVPNGAWPEPLPLPAAHTPGLPVHVLLASSDRLATSALTQGLVQLMAARPDRVELVAVGPAVELAERTGLPVRALPLMPRAEFVRFAAALPNALGVIPLGTTRFDACKSAIKWFDYAMAGVPTLCSAVPPYSDVVDDGRSGRLVADSPSAWQQALCEAVDEPGRAAGWAAAARTEVLARHTLAVTVAAWSAGLLMLGPRLVPARPAAPWLQAWDTAARRLHHWNRLRKLSRTTRRAQSPA